MTATLTLADVERRLRARNPAIVEMVADGDRRMQLAADLLGDGRTAAEFDLGGLSGFLLSLLPRRTRTTPATKAPRMPRTRDENDRLALCFEYERDATLRAEFATVDDYVAFAANRDRGAVHSSLGR